MSTTQHTAGPWIADKPEIIGGEREDAIRYTLAEAGELLASLGRVFSVESISREDV